MHTILHLISLLVIYNCTTKDLGSNVNNTNNSPTIEQRIITIKNKIDAEVVITQQLLKNCKDTYSKHIATIQSTEGEDIKDNFDRCITNITGYIEPILNYYELDYKSDNEQQEKTKIETELKKILSDIEGYKNQLNNLKDNILHHKELKQIFQNNKIQVENTQKIINDIIQINQKIKFVLYVEPENEYEAEEEGEDDTTTRAFKLRYQTLDEICKSIYNMPIRYGIKNENDLLLNESNTDIKNYNDKYKKTFIDLVNKTYKDLQQLDKEIKEHDEYEE